MAKIIWKGVAKKDDPIYGGGFIISYPKRKSSAYLDKTDTKSQKNNKDKGLKNEKKRKITWKDYMKACLRSMIRMIRWWRV